MPDAISKNVRIVYDDLGHGEPALLFMTGWCDNRTVYSHLASRCAAQRRCLVVDWPGHGESETPQGDFGEAGLVEAAVAVIDKSKAQRIIPVSTAHSGWIAIELRRRLGERIPKLVLVDWLVLETPPPFFDALKGLQSRELWQQTRDNLFSMWLADVKNSEIINHVRQEMGAYGYEMWARAAREINSAYARAGSPLKAMSALLPPPRVLHLYSQPKDQAFLESQESFAREHSWFSVRRLDGETHFPSLEAPDATAAAIDEFIAKPT